MLGAVRTIDLLQVLVNFLEVLDGQGQHLAAVGFRALSLVVLCQLVKHDLELSSCRRLVFNIVSGQTIQELSQVVNCGGLAILIELDGLHLVQLLYLLQDLFFALARLGNRVVDQDRFESLCTIFLVLGHLIFNNLRLFCF